MALLGKFLSTNILCQKCEGKGTKSSSSRRCYGCQGTGTKITIQRHGTVLFQQLQHVCQKCGGSGEGIREKDMCLRCKGSKVIQKNKVFKVHIKRGMQQG